MEKKDIVLIANYWHFEQEKASSRYRTFADMLCERYDLEIITSTFCHATKKQRDVSALGLDKLPYKMTLQHESGYRRNVSLRRIRSYTEFGRNVLSYLKKRETPDLIILSIPSLAVADYVSAYAEEKGIPLILDIQDLWPEAFKMALNVPVLSDCLFASLKQQAERAYARADVIMAVSETYVKRGKLVNPRAAGLSIYIGTDSRLVEEKLAGAEDVPRDEGRFVVGYVGALGHSYDIRSVIDALAVLKKQGHDNLLFRVMGDGVCRATFERYAKRRGVSCDFTGKLEYGAMMKTLMQCDVAVNPIAGKSVSSIINKVSDYAAAGVPVINTQNSAEYRALLDRYEAGINVENGNVRELAEAIHRYYSDDRLRREHGRNERNMYEELFDRCKIYPRLMDTMEELLESAGKKAESAS